MEDSQVVLESNGGGLLDTLTNQTNTSYDSEANNNLIAVTWFGGFATEKDIQGRGDCHVYHTMLVKLYTDDLLVLLQRMLCLKPLEMIPNGQCW
jgi:hypothetical protein